MADFQGLLVWQEAHELVLEVYRATRGFPASEQFQLTRQLCRSAASIPANLAEGMGKNGNRERARYTNIALGSSSEVRYHLLLARDLGFLDPVRYNDLTLKAERVGRMLQALYRTLRKKGAIR